MVLAGGANCPNFLQGIGVKDPHLIELRVGNVNQPVLAVDGNSNGIDKTFLNLVDDFMLGVEDQNAMQLAVCNEDAIVVVNRNRVGQCKGCFELIADQTGVAGFGVENKDCAYALIGHIEIAL